MLPGNIHKEKVNKHFSTRGMAPLITVCLCDNVSFNQGSCVQTPLMGRQNTKYFVDSCPPWRTRFAVTWLYLFIFSLFWYLPKIGFTINIWFFKKITKFEIHQASKSSKETRWRFIFCNKKKKRLKIVTIHKSRNFPWQTSGQQINLFWCWLISVVSGGLIFLLFGLKMTCLLKAM